MIVDNLSRMARRVLVVAVWLDTANRVTVGQYSVGGRVAVLRWRMLSLISIVRLLAVMRSRRRRRRSAVRIGVRGRRVGGRSWVTRYANWRERRLPLLLSLLLLRLRLSGWVWVLAVRAWSVGSSTPGITEPGIGDGWEVERRGLTRSREGRVGR
jgi:hypothetical protein